MVDVLVTGDPSARFVVRFLVPRDFELTGTAFSLAELTGLEVVDAAAPIPQRGMHVERADSGDGSLFAYCAGGLQSRTARGGAVPPDAERRNQRSAV